MFLRQLAPYIVGKKKQVDLDLAMEPGEGAKTHALLRELKGKGKMKTAKIDRYNPGTSVTYGPIKDLPRGIFRNHEAQLIRVQIQHQKQVDTLKTFHIDDLDKAVALYKETKAKIRMDKDYEITDFRSVSSRRQTAI